MVLIKDTCLYPFIGQLFVSAIYTLCKCMIIRTGLREVSYLGKREVLCVENGSHFCTPVIMNMCNVTFQVLRLSTFVFNKCSDNNFHVYICG